MNGYLIVGLVAAVGGIVAWKMGVLCQPLKIGCPSETEIGSHGGVTTRVGIGGGDKCYSQLMGSQGSRMMCHCQGSEKAFEMGPRYNLVPVETSCKACKNECNKRRVSVAEEFEPKLKDGLGFTGYTTVARTDLNRLIVA